MIGVDASGVSNRLPGAFELNESVESNAWVDCEPGELVESDALVLLDFLPESCFAVEGEDTELDVELCSTAE